MFFQLLYIHLYRPFLKYTRSTSPLPAHVSPRKYCTQAAGAVSKLLRLYKRTHGLRQICNIAIYIAHSACTIHLLNLPDKNARRDMIHGVKHLEEMGECWTAGRRTMQVLRLCADRWNISMPEEAEVVFTRVKGKWGSGDNAPSPISPQSLANMAKQITSQPLPDLMARNVQQQSMMRHAMIPQMQGGMSAAMAASPAETIDTRRSSGGLSMPPQSAADLSRDVHKVRASTYLTKSQQDAWNAHRARMANTQAAALGNSSAPGDQNAAKMFGGVDSLIEETQDWFFKDQNQLAVGFENWGEPQQDWGTLDLSFFDGDGTASGGQVKTNGQSPAYNDRVYSYDAGMAGDMGNGYGQYPAYGEANMDMNMNMTNEGVPVNMGMDMGMDMNMGMGMGMNMRRGNENGLKRAMPSQNTGFDDEVYY